MLISLLEAFSPVGYRVESEVSDSSPWTTLTDGTTTIRKLVRDGYYVVDKTLTATGFAGTEGVDWENVKATACSLLYPNNLILTEIIGGIQLDWSDRSTIEDGFEIWISIDSAAYVLLDTVGAGVTTYQDLTDYAGSTVEYKVRTYKGTTYSAYSGEESITIAAEITNLAVTWAEDYAVLTWDEQATWDTEIYSSRDDINWTLEETVTTGTETTTNHCWQGTTMYFRARPKKGAEYGNYCTSVNIVTPLVFKFDCNPTATLAFDSHLGLPAGKTVRVSWGSFNGGVEYYTDYTTTTTPAHVYGNAGEGTQDPCYVKLSGDINSITILNINLKSLVSGDISKWVLPTGLITLYLYQNKLTGDLSNWVIPASMVDLRLYNGATGENTFTGDLSSWSLPSGLRICWLSYNAFTAPPRGELKGIEASTAGFYMRDCSCNTAALDAFLAYANTYFGSNTPIKNSLFQLANNFTSNMGIPTGGNSNTDRVGIQNKYTAAGFTATITVRTS